MGDAEPFHTHYAPSDFLSPTSAPLLLGFGRIGARAAPFLQLALILLGVQVALSNAAVLCFMAICA